MKKIITLLSIIFCLNAKAQYVTIPDANFAYYLQGLIPAAMSGNQMDTTHPLVTTTTRLISIPNYYITDFTGVQYFDSLKILDCSHNPMANLPPLPSTLKGLDCSNTFLTNLTNLPNSIIHLDCSHDSLNNLPANLPSSLEWLNCSNMIHLTSLPVNLPTSLDTLYCGSDSLTFLPTLPNSMKYLLCWSNYITALPPLPTSLQTLYCSGNYLSSLPALPPSLSYLWCGGPTFTSLPTLPNSLATLICGGSSLTSLPSLPNSLTFLFCSYNSLTSLPALPNNPLAIYCDHNLLTSLPTLPDSLQLLHCGYNNITCFPTFPKAISTYTAPIMIDPNPYTCLPNYVPYLGADTVTHPLCSAGNLYGCPVVDTCPPYVTFVLTKDTLQSNTWNCTPNYSSNVINAKWYWGDGTSTVGLYTSHTYTTAGWYNLCVTVYSSCGDSLNVCQNDSLYRPSSNSSMVYINILNNTTGVKQNIASDNLNIYPNPTSDQFFIETNTTDKLNVDLYDVNGRHVFSKSVNDKSNINVATLDNGTYTLTIKTVDRVINKKLVILR